MSQMRKVIVCVLVSTFVVGLLAADGEAQRRRRRRAQRPQEAPQSEGIGEALGDLTWGAASKAVYQHFAGKVRERYAERLTKAPDAITEDRLRHDLSEEVRAVRRSYVRFQGQTTGWDVSFLRDEFTHNNQESMLVVRDGNSQNFYFFIRNRLWKWFKAFDADVFQGQTFEQFAGALQGRFGNAAERRGSLTARGEEMRWLEWQDANTRLRAIDQTRFYGFYCLVFEEKATVAQLAELRVNQAAPRATTHALVDAVTSGEDGASASTANQDVVDRITGRIRRRTDAEETSMSSMGSTPPRMTGSTPAPPSMASSTSDDPLRDLDF